MFLANVLQPLIDVFEALLKGVFHDGLGLSWGTSIVALTIVVRAALLPLTFRQMRSMQKMAHLQPEIKALQQRYKNDKERLNQETMRFYRENKVNPAASCLPMVAQIPVFISLFYMLRVDLRHDICPDVNPPHIAHPKPCGDGGEASWFFIHDLTNRAHGGVLVVLVLLYIGSQMASTLLMSTTTDRTQRILFLALPFVFVTFVFRFPAGLLVYWITTNLWTIVQGLLVKRRLGPLRPALAPGESPPSLFDSIKELRGGGATAAEPAASPRAERKVKDRELVSTGGSEPKGKPAGPPPAPPRKKKKRSGRRR